MTPEIVLAAIAELANAPGAPKTIDPTAVARHLAGNDTKEWGRMVRQLRPVFIRLAKDGEIDLVRKGKLADPEQLRGVYRLRMKPAAR